MQIEVDEEKLKIVFTGWSSVSQKKPLSSCPGPTGQDNENSLTETQIFLVINACLFFINLFLCPVLVGQLQDVHPIVVDGEEQKEVCDGLWSHVLLAINTLI